MWGGGGHEGFRAGVVLGAGGVAGTEINRGSDDGNGDGGTWTLPGVSVCLTVDPSNTGMS